MLRASARAPAELSFLIVPGVLANDAVSAIIKPALLANNWTALHGRSGGGLELVLHYQKHGVEAWAETHRPECASVDVVEVAPMPFHFTLTPPFATPEPVDAATGDFPWLCRAPVSEAGRRTLHRSTSPSRSQ